MSTTRSKDRSSDCTFTFADGRRCRMPRQFTLSREGSGHPFLCCFHARREAQAQAAEEVGRDIRFFLSGDYLSACDLSLALGRVFAAAARGQLKPKTAGTLAYLGQTLLQTIHLAENEYINAFSTDRWRRVIHAHVNENSNYLFPAAPSVEAPPLAATPVRVEAVEHAPSGHCIRRGGLQPGSSSTTAATRLSAQPSTQASSATHEGFTLSPEGPGSSSPASRLQQEPGVSNHATASAARSSSPTDPAPVSSATAASPSVEDASLPMATGLLAKVCSSAPPQLPRNAAQFAATIFASAPSTLIPSQSLPTEPYSGRVADDFAAQRHADAGAATVSVGAGLEFTLRQEGPALTSPRTVSVGAGLQPALSSPHTPRPTRSSPVAKPAAPSQPPSSQNPKPAAAPPTGPSGAPIFAALPPRNPAPPPTRRGRQIRPWYLPE